MGGLAAQKDRETKIIPGGFRLLSQSTPFGRAELPGFKKQPYYSCKWGFIQSTLCML